MASKTEEKKEKKNKEKKTRTKNNKLKKILPFKKKKKNEEIEVLEIDESSDKKKKKKKRRLIFSYGPVEFTFNFISLVFVICVGLYYGGRSFYYYSKQTKVAKETAQTLNGLILDNHQLEKDHKADGLHQDENGYFLRGKVKDNYVLFANRLFRVLRVNDDNTVKLVTDDLVASFNFGEFTTYDNSNVRMWLTSVADNEYSGIYQKTIPAVDHFLTDTTYTIDKLYEDKVESGDVEFKEKVVSVSLDDYITSGGKSGFLNNGKLYFLLGYDDMDSNLYVEEDGSISDCSNLDGYGIRGVITLNKNIPVSQGTGTKKDPYVIDQGDNRNYVDSYVKLGDDIWKVFEDKDGKLKMYLNDYIKVNGEYVFKPYSYTNTVFNFYEDGNVGQFLMFDYKNSLSYKDLLVQNSYPYGQMSAETGMSFFPHIFSAYYTSDIAMLNLFDYVSNNELNDYYRDNKAADLTATQYTVLANGAVDEVDVIETRRVVPVISIESKILKSGSGKIDNPYVVG